MTSRGQVTPQLARGLRSGRFARTLPRLGLAVGLIGCAGGWVQRRTPASGPLVGVAAAALPASAQLAALYPSFVHQRTPSSCSVASAGTVLNAILAAQGRPGLSPEAILASDPSGAWARQTADANSPGLTLEAMALHLLRLLTQAGLRRVAVDVVPVGAVSASAIANLAQLLERAERTPQTLFLVANFLQSGATPEGDPVGHFSPLGAYSSGRQAVLVLDVDPEVPSPYWTPLADLVAAMQRPDSMAAQPRGYLVVRLK